ncbi:site-specific DNA-methyltransferase [Dehalococcoides mccartyi]|jgi:Adenine specific DNA methylase Mod|uniref:DNA methylase n=1 Tax=Dehalococcoides mccartyi TaxID=61435 RepID=A0AB33HSV2_9CHLR|nr:site-specific DNA-methyltransferase [Dehalococcoides mccartyi]BAZ97476.1 DNA methylase [Dehalococcoides mccartyi]
MAKSEKTKPPVNIEAFKYKDRRKNIPTEELRDFVVKDEASPKTILYSRDPSLDPQLVWKGKDEQDKQDLAVPAVPVYIQEKIHPKHIIEDLRAQANKGKPAQLDLFSDFNGIKFEEMVEFYQHEQNWSNRMILGDSLLVMTSLAEKEGLKGRVQMIYIDPPYGIKFGSNWQVSTRKRDVKDGSAGDATRQPEQVKAFRDTWKLGIHSYLTYLRDRLTVARDLLTETGSVFVQIGDENVHLVRSLMDEVFGSDNFCAVITFRKTGGFSAELIDCVVDYLLWYAKDKTNVKYRSLAIPKKQETVETQYDMIELSDETIRRLTSEESSGETILPEGKRFMDDNLLSQGETASGTFPFDYNGRTYIPSSGYHWKTTKEGLARLSLARRVLPMGNWLKYKRYLSDLPITGLGNVWLDTVPSTYADSKIYAVQTATKVIERCLLMTTDPGDLVLDPTCGSGTTAYASEQWGRRWITIDTSRVALALARTRLMAGRFPYYLLADSPEGIKKETELTGRTPPDYKTEGDIRKGFVYKRVPHVTLKSIANNPDIKEGMSRKEIDAAIARYAETETLHDQPNEDNKRIRVTGPFTVESLSPHRVIAVDEERPAAELEAQKEASAGQFETMILDNLKKAGVENRVKKERLRFDRLEPYAGEWLHAEGEYTEKDGKIRRVAVCIGPEHGTVGPDLVKDAAKEAVKGVGFDLLIICGFAFDPHVSEEAKRYGRLNILITRMNPDLAMGDALLKTTGAGNLFMVFGELDVAIRKQKDNKVVVEIKGVDVYDPTTGQIRNSSTDDIACWFIDTDYNEESFFVRHAYFTGAEEPYDKLKRALRAEIDEAAWSALYSTTSRPFDPPKTGKIAVKVINHYGDEVLKVYEVK